MRTALLVAACFCALAACGSDPDPAPGSDPAAFGYTRREQLHDIVSRVEPDGEGAWTLAFERSARVYRIDAKITLRAAELAAAARALQANRHEVYATILVHEDAPDKKDMATTTRFTKGRYPWIVVRLSAQPDPAIAR